MKTLFLTAAAAATSLALAGCGQPNNDAANTTKAGAAGTMAAPTTGGMAAAPTPGMAPAGAVEDYVAQAASADLYEVQSGQLIMAQSGNSEVKRFAQEMIDEHRASAALLATAAQRSAMPAPRTTMLAAQQTRYNALRDAGADMDRLYLDQQRTAHAEAIVLHKSLTDNAATPEPLGNYARDLIPRIEGHVRMLRDITLTGSRT